MYRGPRDTDKFSRRDILKRGCGVAATGILSSLVTPAARAQTFFQSFWANRKWQTGVGDTWTATSTTGAPAARGNHIGLWTGSQMIVWGGQHGGTYYNSGGRFDPSTNTWSSTTTTGAPSGRNGFTGIWADGVMIVWGGFGGSSVLQTGGRYDPSANSWAATSTGAAPSARTNHCAVWTGTEMIVWGGQNSSGSTVYNTGGRYDPTTDTWSSISTSGAPSARTNMRAAWVGGRMVVWGGNDNSGELKTGGIYDPASDSWTATSTVGAPSARANFWMGTMGTLAVIWGGAKGSTYYNDGFVFDPLANVWGTISGLNLNLQPSKAPPCHHQPPWTGSSLIIWGGEGSSNYNKGAFYNPTFRSWNSMTTSGAPTARRSYSVIWTGSKVIVWGGNDGSDRNTGGMYG